MRYVIVGAGAAGIGAAETLRRSDPGGSIALISEEAGPIYSRCLLPKFLAGELSEKGLAFKSEDFLAHLNVQFYPGERVEALKTASQEVCLASGKKVPYDKLLLACGASPSFPPIRGKDRPGVLGLRSLKDAHAIIGALQGKASQAVVIGGGLIGLDVAKALKQRGLGVTVVEIAPHLLPQQLDPLAAGLVQRRFEQAGVSLALGRTVQEINGTFFSKRVKAVHLDNGERIECQLVVIAAGVKPNLDLARGANILVNQGVWVNDYLETSLGDRVYAAGDVAESMNLLTGSTSLSPFWPNAVHQGRVAALNMAGEKVRYPGTLAMQGSAEFYHLPVASYGLPPSDCENLETVASHLPAQGIYQKLSLDQGVPQGMILVGDIRKAGVLSALIRKRVDLSEIKHQIWEPGFGYAHFLKGKVPDFRNYLREAA